MVKNGFVSFKILTHFENESAGTKGSMWIKATHNINDIAGIFEYVNDDGEVCEGCDVMSYSGYSVICDVPYLKMKKIITDHNLISVNAVNN